MTKPFKVKDVVIPNSAIADLLTPSEIRMLKNRWQILQYLREGLSIRKIARQVKVGTDTVMRVTRMLKKSKLPHVLDKKGVGQVKTQTSWVFGKSE